MEILGIGTPELIAILIIMLVVAGPKRMIQWAYYLGRYTAKARKMWAEVMATVQKEINDSGIEVNLPKDIPTRASLQTEMAKAFSGFSNPAREILNDVEAELKQTQNAAALSETIEPEKVYHGN